MNYARRPQYGRLLHAMTAACASAAALLVAVVLVSARVMSLAGLALLVAVGFGSYARHWLGLAGRSRVGARSEDEVTCHLSTLERDGWRLRHSLPWRGSGDIDSVAIAPSGIAFAIETKTRSNEAPHLARVHEQAVWLSRRRLTPLTSGLARPPRRPQSRASTRATHGRDGTARTRPYSYGVADQMTDEEHAMRADMAPGGTFPDYELTDHTETRRSLSELQGDDPLILVLARGHYCPKDHQQHLELAAAYPKIAVAYTQIVTISTDNILETREFRASVGAQWTFLSDAGRKLQKDLDIQEYTDPHHDPMVPHTLVIKPGLVIHSLYNGYWFWGRPSIAELWRDLREATREIRPDWDLSASGLREAWDAGDRSRFYGDKDLDPSLRAA
jgi:peroxiredoxin